MNYPTMEEVEVADRLQLCKWHRFLLSPGMSAIDAEHWNWREIMEKEASVQDRIEKRLQEFGGFTPEISKAIGWDAMVV